MEARCEKCGICHEGKYGSGRFCSVSCSRSYSSNIRRSEVNERVSKKLKGLINGKLPVHGDVEITCKTCGSIRTKRWRDRRIKFCSRECVQADPATKELIRTKRIQAIQEGNVGYGIKCEFKGVRCDSALEYAFLAWYTQTHPDASIERFKGSLSGEGITYVPDFIVDGKIIVEVKYNAPYIGDALSKKWKTYVDTMERKKVLLANSGMEYMWVTEKDIGVVFYKKCLREIKASLKHE